MNNFERSLYEHEKCFQCSGYYGPCFGQPVCGICHAFLHPSQVEHTTPQNNHEKSDDGDSGNEEPGPEEQQGNFYQMPQQQLNQAVDNADREHLQPPQQQQQQLQQQQEQEQEHQVQQQQQHQQHDVFQPMHQPVLQGEHQSVGSSSSPSSNSSSSSSSSSSGGTRAEGAAGTSDVGVLSHVTQQPNSLVGNKGQCTPFLSGCEGRETITNVSKTLQEKINALTCPRPPDNLDSELIDRIPPEVLVYVFALLDDLSLWTVAQVCRRWKELVERYVTEGHWRTYTNLRWPLFQALYRDVPWKLVYTQLTESAPCMLCLHQMSVHTAPPTNENSWRRNRLRNELRTLKSDPPEGIAAAPLDKLSLHWQASIRGPAGSPYHGGTFFLYIQIPPSYPLCPPVVRFITKIFHPNVSRHGDIGIDSIQHNWSLALTISKVLISIQSLFTDPYVRVCMEPRVGLLYETQKSEFERIAKEWTWRYAMHDGIIPEEPRTPSTAPISCLVAAQMSIDELSECQMEVEDSSAAAAAAFQNQVEEVLAPTARQN